MAWFSPFPFVWVGVLGTKLRDHCLLQLLVQEKVGNLQLCGVVRHRQCWGSITGITMKNVTHEICYANQHKCL